MFQLYKFDRETALYHNELLYGAFIEVSTTDSRDRAFADHLWNARFGPSPFNRTFVLIVESQQTFVDCWFFPQGVPLHPFRETPLLRGGRRQLLHEIHKRQGIVKPGQRGIRIMPKNNADGMSLN